MGNRKIVPHFIEILTLGFISSCSDFTRAVNFDAMSAALKRNFVKSAVKSSFDIYCKGTMLIRLLRRTDCAGRCTTLFY